VGEQEGFAPFVFVHGSGSVKAEAIWEEIEQVVVPV